MKNSILIIIVTLIFATSCKENTSKKVIKSKVEKVNEIPFSGTWARSFTMGKGVDAKVTYTVFQDSIQYIMNGPMVMKYTLVKDAFLSKSNRWIGKRGETPYVIFFKNVSKDSITLLKMKVESKEKAIKMAFPSDTARSKFSSWNTFKKK